MIEALPAVSFGTLNEVCNNAAPFALTGGLPATESGVGTGVYSGPGVNSSNGTFDPSAAGVGTQTLTYTYTSQLGCVESATQTISVSACKPCVDPPKLLTPNGDGFYDRWVVINCTSIKSVKAKVYNRWGGLVYSNDVYNNQWDGTYNGKPLPDGTYYYVIIAQQGNNPPYKITGNVTIMR